MTTKDLIKAIDDYISNDVSRKRNFLYIWDPELGWCTIDAIKLRNGEMILQSNEIDERRYSLRLNFIRHCACFFDADTTVTAMLVDEDEDYEFIYPHSCSEDSDDGALCLWWGE